MCKVRVKWGERKSRTIKVNPNGVAMLAIGPDNKIAIAKPLGPREKRPQGVVIVSIPLKGGKIRGPIETKPEISENFSVAALD